MHPLQQVFDHPGGHILRAERAVSMIGLQERVGALAIHRPVDENPDVPVNTKLRGQNDVNYNKWHYSNRKESKQECLQDTIFELYRLLRCDLTPPNQI